MSTTPALRHLVGVYFNQDWFEDYANEDAAVAAFVAESDDLVARLPDEIAWVLSEYSTEAEVERYLDLQGCEYLPPASFGGYRGWLTWIAERVRTATTQR